MLSPRRVIHAMVSIAIIWTATPLSAQDASSVEAAKEVLAKETYVRPPETIAKLVTAPRHLSVSLTNPSPDRRYFLKEQTEGLPSVNAFGKPHIYSVDFRSIRQRIAPGRSPRVARWFCR